MEMPAIEPATSWLNYTIVSYIAHGVFQANGPWSQVMNSWRFACICGRHLQSCCFNCPPARKTPCTLMPAVKALTNTVSYIISYHILNKNVLSQLLMIFFGMSKTKTKMFYVVNIKEVQIALSSINFSKSSKQTQRLGRYIFTCKVA